MAKAKRNTSAVPAIGRLMSRLQDKKTLRFSWNEEYWLECADYLEEVAAWIREQLEPPCVLVEDNSRAGANVPEFTRTKEKRSSNQ
jgi:hypothetical protein